MFSKPARTPVTYVNVSRYQNGTPSPNSARWDVDDAEPGWASGNAKHGPRRSPRRNPSEHMMVDMDGEFNGGMGGEGEGYGSFYGDDEFGGGNNPTQRVLDREVCLHYCVWYSQVHIVIRGSLTLQLGRMYVGVWSKSSLIG